MSGSERFRVRVETAFVASHAIGPAGEPRPLHEHEWQVAVTVESEVLDRIAIVVDFRKLRADTERVLDEIRGSRLPTHADLSGCLATPRRVARWLCNRMTQQSLEESYRVVEVEVGCDPGVSFIVTAH